MRTQPWCDAHAAIAGFNVWAAQDGMFSVALSATERVAQEAAVAKAAAELGVARRALVNAMSAQDTALLTTALTDASQCAAPVMCNHSG